MSKLIDTLRPEIGLAHRSDWMTIDQDMIDRFAHATLDHQFIHVDPVRASATSFGGTVAHGFLTLSLLPHLRSSIAGLRQPEGTIGVNYGLDRVRFVHPVRSGSRVRAAATLIALDEKGPGQIQLTHTMVVEIEGEDKPAMIATWLTRFIG